MNGRIVVGVDAGGSVTTAIASRGSEDMRTAHGGPANPTTIGIADAADVILQTIREAVDRERPDAIYVGAAGAGRRHVAEQLQSYLGAAYPQARIAVADDAPLVLRSAVPDGPAVALVAGTGSIAYAENGERRARVGGWGSLLGDEGSAFAIGFAAARLFARTLDGRASREETSALVERALGATTRDELLSAIYDSRLDPARIAALAPPILAFAGKGNRASTKIVQQAAQDLGELVRSAARAVALEDSARVVLAGGLLRENSLLTFLLETRIVNELPGASVLRYAGEPALGAVRLAQAL